MPIGIDITSGEVVLYKFKEDPNSAENTLITSGNGCGKSYLVSP